MSAWGIGLLENDIAADARLSFDEVLAGGGTVADAVATVMKEWEDDLDDDDDRTDLILALAWLASEQRSVPDWLAAEARSLIGEQASLSMWGDSPAAQSRLELEAQLLAILDGRAAHPGRTGRLLPGGLE